jgi:hypothetical protein
MIVLEIEVADIINQKLPATMRAQIICYGKIYPPGDSLDQLN